MIERVTYECELCETHYLNPADAEACEAIHIPPIREDIKVLYRQNEEYPYRIIVAFETGKRIAFDIKSYLSDEQ